MLDVWLNSIQFKIKTAYVLVEIDCANFYVSTSSIYSIVETLISQNTSKAKNEL